MTRAALVGLALLAVVLGLRGCGAEARAEAAEQRADSLYLEHVAQRGSLQDAIEERDAALQLEVARADSAEARADRAEARRPALVERVVHVAGPDSAVVRAAIEEVANSITVHEIRPLRVTVSALRTQVSLYRWSDSTWAESYRIQGQALEAARAEARAWRAASRPKLFGLFHAEPEIVYVAGVVTGVATGGLVAWLVTR